MRRTSFALIGAVVWMGCSSETVGPLVPNIPDPNNPNNPPANPPPVIPENAPLFHRDIEPLLQDRCQTCHRQGGIAPFSLMTFDEVRIRAAQMVTETSAKRMPPWGALSTDECQPRFGFRGDQHLTDEQIKLFADWFAADTPEGDIKDAPAPRTFEDLGELARVDAELRPENGWTVTGTRDQFRCFVIDPHWTTDQWIVGTKFIPGNPQIVHHAITFLDPNRNSERMMGPDGSYECFAGPGFNETSILSAWAPGSPGGDLDNEIAYQINAGTLLVMQVHYHPVGNEGATDRSTLQVHIGDTRPRWLSQILLIGNFEGDIGGGDGLMAGPNDSNGPEFVIPAGAKNHTETLRFTLPERIGQNGSIQVPTLKVIGVGTHMHYVGTDMKFEIERPAPKTDEPARECMIQTPVWNFQWQRGYAYDVAVDDAPEWRPGDRLHMRCTYDNSMDNRFVANALREQGLDAPRDVRLGEMTLDEMCLAALAIAYPNPF